jgi:hypothetical protein
MLLVAPGVRRIVTHDICSHGSESVCVFFFCIQFQFNLLSTN